MSRQIEPASPACSQDGIDERRAQWAAELPEVDTRGMAILGRARWITLTARPPTEAIFKTHGLDSGEADVLFSLLRSGPPYRLRPTELFRSLMISSGGLTDRLNRLTKAGLIRRASAEGDGRSLPVELTEEGIARAREAFREDMAIEAAMLDGLTEDEQVRLADLLRKLASTVTATRPFG
ncbi:MarR family winged helix-turn-helix transcriptional regulator [Microvirga tunisiensis]|uniref:MarR family transcriptional regulator n=1 Tax=Microvirga tunisiensis TaxID=2108360 RepID=A0A5N7MLU6_9HYPH|nr:MarR family transcriptional regulator [Microvirga tunisiensis]MPR06813.1 MarR family transcriptional regulator [Microvirga tunisiensis]MPR24926.1 MarR family transcriptional regulator [Microvirga tunisiensis]